MNELLLKGVISFTSSYFGKQAAGKSEEKYYREIDQQFSKIVNSVSEQTQINYPNVLGGSINQIFTNKNIFNELIKILYKKTQIDIENIYSILDKDTLPKEFVEEFIINLKNELLNSRLFDNLFSENDIYHNINSIKEILSEKLKDRFDYEIFLQDYSKTAINNISQINFFGLSLSPEVEKSRKLLQDIYVIPNFKAINNVDNIIQITDEKSNEIKKYIDKRRANLKFDDLINNIYNDNKHTVILGKPGAGKSILIKYLMYVLLNKQIKHPLTEYLPIRVELRKYLQFKKNQNLNFTHYIFHLLGAEYGIINISLEDLIKILKNQKTLFLFDGLDEIFHVNDKLEIKNDIINFLQLNNNAKGIVTSRNNGYEEAKMNETVFSEIEIMDFNDEKISEYVKKWYIEKEKDKSILEREVNTFLSLKKELDTELISNPLSLSLIVILYRNVGKIPNSKLEIYRGCTNTLVEEWDDIKELKFDLKVKAKRTRIFTNLAFWQYSLLSGKKENIDLINYRKVLHEVQNIILSFNDVTDDIYEAEKFAKEFLEYAEKRSIYFDNNFTHKTFHEYYTALWIYQNYDAKGKLNERNEIISKYIDNSYWHIVLELLISLIDERQGDEEVINELIKEQIKNVDNIISHSMLLNVLRNINNISQSVVETLIRQSIILAIKQFKIPTINEESSLLGQRSTSNKIFSDLEELKGNEKYKEVINKVLIDIEEVFINNEEELLKYIVFTHELYDIEFNEKYYLLLKKYEMKSMYIFQLMNDRKSDYLDNTLKFIGYFGVDNLNELHNVWFNKDDFKLGYIYHFILNENNSLEKMKSNLLLLQSNGVKMSLLKTAIETVKDIKEFRLKESLITLVLQLADEEIKSRKPTKKLAQSNSL